MGKPLSELSLQELWQLFPIILKDHNPAYRAWYLAKEEEIRNNLTGIPIIRINHIGSSAVPGLISKPTIDILLEVDRSCNLTELKDQLLQAGWILMLSEDQPELRLEFNQGYTQNGFAERVFHLHVRYYADWDELYFRDYLLAHPAIAEEYAQLKLGLWKQYEHNRDGYTQAKSQFVQKYSALAHAEFGKKYMCQGDGGCGTFTPRLF